jgi:hypothetical protein
VRTPRERRMVKRVSDCSGGQRRSSPDCKSKRGEVFWWIFMNGDAARKASTSSGRRPIPTNRSSV